MSYQNDKEQFKTPLKFFTKLAVRSKKSSPQTLKSRFMYLLSESLSPFLNNFTLVAWQQKVNAVEATWTGRRNKMLKMCDYEMVNEVWKTLYNKTRDSVYNQSLYKKQKPLQVFKPDFTAVRHKIIFTENCSKDKLLETFFSKSTQERTKPTTEDPQLRSARKLVVEWPVEVTMGILTKVPIKQSLFQSKSLSGYKLAPKSGRKIPKWIEIDAENNQLIILAFSTDFDRTVNYKGTWRGWLIATSESTELKAINVVITAKKNNDYYENKYNYRVEMRLSSQKINVSFFKLENI